MRVPPGERRAMLRRLALLLLVQLLMIIYVMMPYYISPYLYNKGDPNGAATYAVQLANATVRERSIPWLSAPSLPRVLSLEEHDSCVQLIGLVDHLFRKRQIPYVLAYGNLVGSYVMHDLLPWDDDIDVLVSWSKYDRFKLFLEHDLKPHGLDVQVHDTLRVNTMKVFFSNGSRAGIRPWTWPFIDIAFYEENATHVWNQNVEFAGDVMLPREWFYPITSRPFAWLWLPAPRNTAKFLERRYGRLKCIRYAWNHKDELPSWSIAYAPCESLQTFYPFVWREPHSKGVKETVKLNGQILYSVIVNDTYNGQFAPFQF